MNLRSNLFLAAVCAPDTSALVIPATLEIDFETGSPTTRSPAW